MLDLQICFAENCDSVVYRDITGVYSAEHTGGYGAPNPASPAAFATYVLRGWPPKVDPTTTAPSLVKNLLTNIPTPDDDGYYSWDIPITEFSGLSVITSGVWFFEAVATMDDAVYEADNSPIFTRDLKTTVIDPLMKSADPECGCGEGCTNPYDLFSMYQTVACNGACSGDQAQSLIDYLYSIPVC